MAVDQWTGIDHRHLLMPHQVGVGAGPRHGARIGCRHAAHPVGQAINPASFYTHASPRHRRSGQIPNRHHRIHIGVVIHTIHLEPEQA